ncbi:hypothetical protein Vadar_010647 [Vaccinium darrowii]|uniref:Uncharacterized protein n=1 Tax=Vaccinium darrowii TaxID=229202 RepID=A0ACB7Y647_9ERIC|nr:hypothetical protein Vadar_010647 [Vaccinium darrowii]
MSNWVLLNCSHLWGKKIETFDDHSLKDLLFKLSRINPETTRRFLRVSELKPEDVNEIWLGFEFVYEKFEIEVEKVKSLWGVFKWANSQGKGFKHLPKSFEIIAKMLVRAGLFREIEFLLYTMDREGV